MYTFYVLTSNVLFCKFILPVCGVMDQSDPQLPSKEGEENNITTINLTGGVIVKKLKFVYIYHTMD